MSDRQQDEFNSAFDDGEYIGDWSEFPYPVYNFSGMHEILDDLAKTGRIPEWEELERMNKEYRHKGELMNNEATPDDWLDCWLYISRLPGNNTKSEE